MRNSLLAPLALASVALGTAQAQRVRGIVRDAATMTPLAGVVVTLVDTSGATISRTIANGEGRFGFEAASRAAHLRLIRIGYEPRDFGLPARADTVLQFAMVRIPPMLTPVQVTDRELVTR